MRPWKWGIWPWNWRQVRKANISKEDRDLFERYGEAVIGSVLAGASCPTAPELNAIIPGNICLPENPGKCTAARDWLTECRDAHERREQRLETIEIGVVALITVEIALSIIFGVVGIYEAWKQGNVLDHLDKNTAATALQIQRAADATTASLEILRQEGAERAKKPKFALYLGDVPIDKASLRLELDGRQGFPPVAHFEFRLKNEGDAAGSPSQIHVLVPEGVNLNVSPLSPVPELEEPPKPGTRSFTYAIPPMPIGKALRFGGFVTAQGNHPFKITFTITTPQLQTVTPLGSLTVLSLRPPELL